MTIIEATDDAILVAYSHLLNGELVAFPTETVYGLGANARDGEAVAKIFEAKGRPRFNPLIVHVGNLDAARQIGDFSDMALRFAEAFWPGPLSMVVPLKPSAGISDLVTTGLDTIALRVPGHPIAQALLSRSDLAIAAPSANRSGHVSPTSAQHVYEDLADAPACILDGGPCNVGLESTVVGFEGADVYLLRAGGVTREELETVVGRPVSVAVLGDGNNTPISPGQLLSHYAPNASVRLNATNVEAGEAVLGFGRNGGVDFDGRECPFINLSETGDLREAAVRLFSALRELDSSGVSSIAVAPIPQVGLGEAINDRLKRAAAARPSND